VLRLTPNWRASVLIGSPPFRYSPTKRTRSSTRDRSFHPIARPPASDRTHLPGVCHLSGSDSCHRCRPGRLLPMLPGVTSVIVIGAKRRGVVVSFRGWPPSSGTGPLARSDGRGGGGDRRWRPRPRDRRGGRATSPAGAGS